MRVCIIVEGCYPYVMGGVSSWIQSMILSHPEVEFVIQTIITSRAESGKFLYELPKNVSELHEIYLQDEDWTDSKRRAVRLTGPQRQALCDYMLDRPADLQRLFSIFADRALSLGDLLMGADFLSVVMEMYEQRHKTLPFVDFLWTMRSMYLPLFNVFKSPPPPADLYHCVATGYAGMCGVMGKTLRGGRLLISEHGVYTREREEELIKAAWVRGEYKNVWIDFFGIMSHKAYQLADKVTSLFEDVRTLQIEMGCPAEKTIVTPNGIDEKAFENIPQKDADDPFINVGAVLRIAPIKDIKTMISAFALAKQREPRLKLFLMGPYDEQDEYARECFSLVRALDVKDVVFTGRITVREHIGKMDFTLLTSISEGQPLTILEGFAAKKPCVATNVGNCKGLILGESDVLGAAGVIAPVMAVDKIASGILRLAEDPALCRRMGEIGYQRMLSRYTLGHMRAQYTALYALLSKKEGEA